MQLRAIQKIECDDSKHYFPDLEQDYPYLGVALAGEVGETCNLIKKFERGSMSHTTFKIELAGELADILIYLVMLAGHAGIDLESAWQEKKEYNDRRYLTDEASYRGNRGG